MAGQLIMAYEACQLKATTPGASQAWARNFTRQITLLSAVSIARDGLSSLALASSRDGPCFHTY
jgi:hypothetical protein